MIKDLYAREWELFKSDYLNKFLWIMGGAILFSVMLYWFLLSNQEVTEMMMTQLVQMFEELGVSPEMSLVEMFRIILLQNLRAAFLTVAFGLIPIIVLPLFSSIVTVSSVSVLLAFIQLQGENPLQTFLFGIVPHGIIELPALFLSASLGVFLSLNIARRIFSGEDQQRELMDVISQVGRSFLLVVVPLIIIAAVIESFVTPFVAMYFIK